MSTIKLYEKDSYIKKFSASVVYCERQDEGFSVVLSQTAFFPEGGGQAPDTGRIGEAQVLDVQVNDGIIYHKTDKSLTVGETVDCEICWDVRFSRMQNHTGEHIVSGIIHNIFGYNNVGFHMNDSLVTLNVDGPLGEKDIEKIELEANRAVWANKSVTSIYPAPDEISKYDYRSKLDITENLRLIKIEDYDLCACCAPHVAHTGEIGIIKILGFMPCKKGTKIEMVSGSLALGDYCRLHSQNKNIMSLLSAKRFETAGAVDRILGDLNSAKFTVKKLSGELAMLSVEKYTDKNNLCAFVKNATYDQLQECANSFVDDYDFCCLFSQTDDKTYIYVIVSKEYGVSEKVSKLNTEFNGRGGGRDKFARGKIEASKEQLIDYLLEKA